MPESPKFAHFPQSVIADRVVAALAMLPAERIESLIEEGKIRLLWKQRHVFELTNQNLFWNYLDDYAEICGVPVREFIYGPALPEKTNYSHYDDVVIPLLDQICAEDLVAAAEVVRTTYSNPHFYISEKHTPSAKLLFVLLKYYGTHKDVPEELMHLYSTDINVELDHYRNIRLKERFVFRMNYILDMCTYLKVSPHFVFSLRSPLLCKTSEADRFFDLYCLCSRSQQVTILSMLKQIAPDACKALPDALQNRLAYILACEGGYI